VVLDLPQVARGRERMDIVIRHAEPDDYEALHRIFSGSRAIEGRGCELMYLPPYSPDLNPIEEAFAKLKALLCARLGRVPEKRCWKRWVGRSMQ
jgi:transposase